MSEKRIRKVLAILLVAVMLFGTMSPATFATAATAYPEGVTVEADAEAPGGYMATFVYKNDNPAISKVEIYGSFQFYKVEDIGDFATTGVNTATAYRAPMGEYEVGMFPAGSANVYYPMTGEDGVYTIQIPLPAQQYSYRYRITYSDGTATAAIQDPANTWPGNNGSLFYVGDREHALPGQEYIYAQPEGKAGSYSFVTYNDFNGVARQLGVYLPYGYSASKTYKTLYVSHGGGGNETDWMTVGSVPNIMDNLIAEGKTPEAIVVTMNNTNFSFNNVNVQRNMKEAVIPFVEANYSVSAKAEDRSFCGLSMGAMSSSYLLQNDPTYYAAYGVFSGASSYDLNTADIDAIKDAYIFVSAGSLDMAYVNGNYGRANDNTTKGFHERLVARDIEHTYEIYNGTHSWEVWRESFTDYAQHLNPVYPEGVTVEADGNSPTGYSATFVFKADEAAKVEIDSQVLYFYKAEEGRSVRYTPHQWEKGMFAMNGGTVYNEEMQSVGGYWVLKLPLPSGAYSYRYKVTTEAGTSYTVDPANMPLVNSATGRVANYSMVYMPFDSAKQEIDLSVELPRADEKKGTVEYFTYLNATGAERPLAVYLPYGYDENRAEPYKVLYLSHGGGGHELDWMNDGVVPNMMDNMIVEGRTEPFVVVTMAQQSFTNINEQMNYIMPAVQEKYNVSTTPEGNSYAGLSAGATLTADIYLNNPTDFGYFGIWSSGDLDIRDFSNKTNLDVPKVMVGVGKFDTDRNRYQKAIDFLVELDKVNADYVFYDANGAHDWKLWPRMYEYYLDNVLWKAQAAEITSVTVGVEQLVATLGAKVPVTVLGENLGEVTVKIVSKDGLTVYGEATMTGAGRVIVSIDAAMNIAAGTYDVIATSGTSTMAAELTVVPYNTDIWVVQLDKSAEGKTRFLFAADISAGSKGYDVKVNGVSYKPVQEGNALVIDYQAAEGDVFVVSGVKYAKLFPSYSFSFTVR